jgi:microcystin degradation protein MlrC
MPRVLIAGYQHETNTFAPSLADWAAFNKGSDFPPYRRGAEMLHSFIGVNMPTGGFIDAARSKGWQLIGSGWAGATPSAHVTDDAFERICAAILEDIAHAQVQGLDAVYLDLHGAAVSQSHDDSEAELLSRVRAAVGPRVPIVASLDLHANVSPEMLDLADLMVAYRTYPHVDMAQTGERVAIGLHAMLRRGHREPHIFRRLPFLIPLPAQSTWLSPAKEHYALLPEIEARDASTPSFCMGFPASDIDACAPTLWAYGSRAEATAQTIHEVVSRPEPWRTEVLGAAVACARALEIARSSSRPVVIADTQDNCGAGADSNTTGMLHALLAARAGQIHPQRIAVGMMYDPAAAALAHRLGAGASFEGVLGQSVPRWRDGPMTEPPVTGRFKIVALSDGQCELKGPMMTGLRPNFGPSACLEIEGILVAVVSAKAQLLDREMLRMVGITPEKMAVIVVKSSNHYRADFTPFASAILTAKAPGPMPADPSELPWTKLDPAIRPNP